MSEAMNAAELSALVARVFQPTPDDRLLGIMVDLPDGKVPDDAAWTARRQIAAEWARLLDEQAARVGYRTHLFLYPNVHTNNGDLPDHCWITSACRAPALGLRPRPGSRRAYDRDLRHAPDSHGGHEVQLHRPAQDRGSQAPDAGRHDARLHGRHDPRPAARLHRNQPPGRHPEEPARPGHGGGFRLPTSRGGRPAPPRPPPPYRTRLRRVAP